MKVLILAALAVASFALPFAAQGNSTPTVTNGSQWQRGNVEMTVYLTFDPVHNEATFQAQDDTGLSSRVPATPGPNASVTHTAQAHTQSRTYRVNDRGVMQVQERGDPVWRRMQPRRATQSDDNPGGCPGPWGSDDVTTSPGPGNIPLVQWNI